MSNQEFPKQFQVPKSVEEQANYEGNETLLLFDRVNNPIIRNQIIDMIWKNEESKRGQIVNQVVFDENDKTIPDPDNEFGIKTEKIPYEPDSREKIEERFDQLLGRAMSVTPITFDETIIPSEKVMSLNWSPNKGDKMTTKQKSMALAHEKGHTIRPYRSNPREYIYEFFSQGFDFSKISYSLERYEKEKMAGLLDEEMGYEKAKALSFEYLRNPCELAERMNQLKNYFGMKGDQKFTKAHLDYAREHYVSDIGLDNNMTTLFQAITPETETKFLEIINSAGI